MDVDAISPFTLNWQPLVHEENHLAFDSVKSLSVLGGNALNQFQHLKTTFLLEGLTLQHFIS